MSRFSPFLISFSSVILLNLSRVPLITAQTGRYEVYYVWNQIDYNFPNESIRQELIDNGGYEQINCVPNAIKIYGDQMFVATPRYFPGVPVSLSVIPYKKPWIDQWHKRKTGPKLTPFPSWEMQEAGNCTAFQLVQHMEIDPYGRLWVLDPGRTEALTPLPNNRCPAKIVIIDLNANNTIERIYEFPNEVVNRNSNAIKDTQIACFSRDNCYAYISNINTTHSVVVYDYRNNDSWFATHPDMLPDLEKAAITINGTTTLVPFGITGLGLSPKSTNYSTIYFSQLAGDHIYTIPTSVLNDGQRLKAVPLLLPGEIKDLGPKPQGQSDGVGMDNRGRLFYGSLHESALYSIDTSSRPSTLPEQTRVVKSLRDMQWIDTFAFDNQGFILFTTTKFQRVSTFTIDPKEMNYRIIKYQTKSLSYQYDV